MNNQRLQLYKELSEKRNFSLIPVNNDSKIPSIKKWQGRCTKKVNFVENDYKKNGIILNAGIACGPASGVIVVDIDYPDEFNNWCVEKNIEDPLPETFTVKSGGKSEHYYYEYPKDGREYKKRNNIPGIDILAIGSFVLAPGSVHPDTRRQYSISKDIPVAPAPKWILNVLNGILPVDSKNQCENTTSQSDFMFSSFQQSITPSDKIAEGERNNYLTSVAGKLLNTGISSESLRKALHEENTMKCNPPLNTTEVDQIFNGIIKYHVQPAVICTQQGLADVFVDQNKDIIRFNYSSGAWYIWNGKVWERDEANKINILFKNFLRSLHDRGKYLNTDFGKKLMKVSREYENSPNFDNTIKRAQSDPLITVSIEKFDNELMKLPCLNGTINLINGQLVTHNHSDMFTKMINIEYDDNAECPLFDKFLNEITGYNNNIIQFLYRIFGYILTADTREQCYFIFHGSGANGKTTLLNVLRDILGIFAADISFKSLINKNDRVQHDIHKAVGARLLTCSEVDPDNLMDETVINRITGGEPLSVKRLYENVYDFKPQFKLIITGNHKPNLQSINHATKRRIILVPFFQRFENSNRDNSLHEKLKHEYPGILKKMILGCLKWQKEGLQVPIEIQDATCKYINQVDSVGVFINDACETGTDYMIKSAEFHKQYEQWCRNNGDTAVGKKKLTTIMEDKSFIKKKAGGSEQWIGLRLKTASPPLSFKSIEQIVSYDNNANN